MNKIDHAFLYLKSENARMSLKEMGRHLKKSPQRLKYNLKILEKENILKFPYCIIDYSYFGLILFRVYFRGAYINERERENIINILKSNPFVVSIYELTGEFDLIVEFASPNPSKFNKELKNLSRLIPTLNDYKVILNLVSYTCPRNYIVKNEVLQSMNIEKIIGGDREREQFNLNELRVVKNLILNPTIRIRDLSRKSELNEKTVKTIFKGLMQKNVIKGFKFMFDMNKLGIYKARLFLRLHNLSLEKEIQLTKRVLDIKEIVQINKTVGDWDMELDIETFDQNKIKQIITQIREEYKDIIERFNLIEFYDYYKRDYLPLYLFEVEF